MKIVRSIPALRAQVHAWRKAGKRVALVPTMGNLHAGHIDLVNHARKHAGHVIVSVFVNSLQFGKNEDFGRYPRTPREDAEQLKAADTDILFMPAMDEIYPQGIACQTRIEVPGLSDILCGAFRPGHFSGVVTVVNLLFNIAQPDLALFGEKDYQQLQVIRSMVRDLHLPVAIIGVPTVRDADGLALSSRNRYLTTQERRVAPVIFQTLQATAAQLRAGNHDFDLLKRQGGQALREAGLQADYYEILRPDLAPPGAEDRILVILVAAWLGQARLLDNLTVSF